VINVGVPSAKAVSPASRVCTMEVLADGFEANSDGCSVASGVLPHDGGHEWRSPDGVRPGLLTTDCSGNGAATANFGVGRGKSEAVFRGTSDGTSVHLTRTSKALFSGCHCDVFEEIEGPLTGPFSYSYSEEVLETPGCSRASACTAKAMIFPADEVPVAVPTEPTGVILRP
jgi:hypothetical protein